MGAALVRASVQASVPQLGWESALLTAPQLARASEPPLAHLLARQSDWTLVLRWEAVWGRLSASP